MSNSSNYFRKTNICCLQCLLVKLHKDLSKEGSKVSSIVKNEIYYMLIFYYVKPK